jgi:hypothetical protein
MDYLHCGPRLKQVPVSTVFMPPAMKPTVFIHTNAKQLVGAKVSAYSLQKMSKNPQRFEVQILNLDNYPSLLKYDGARYLHEGSYRIWRASDLQSFTLLRFLPPQLMNYEGRAVVIDPDIFAVSDILELLDRDMGGKAILCCKEVRRKGSPAQNATSVMLLDCSKLRHWRWEDLIEALFAEELDYQDLITLSLESEERIGQLEEEWNHFDTLTERTKLLHNTRITTQPWRTGLPLDWVPRGGKPQPLPEVGLKPTSWIGRLKVALTGQQRNAVTVYQPHPDSNQERFFFRLLKGCLKENVVTESFIRSEMQKNHLRHDALLKISTQL